MRDAILGYVFGVTVGLFVVVLVALTSCGVKASGGTKHEVDGEVTVNVVVKVPLCDAIQDEAQRVECIQTVLSAISKKEAVDEPTNINGDY